MTNFVKQKFQWFFDMNTSSQFCQKIDVKAGGPDVMVRLAPFFSAFKKYKLGSVRIRMVPSATLPVDPTGLSLEAGENTVDPRDLFNPGLVRITNGESMPYDNDNTATVTMNMNQYYGMMLDKRWYKFRLQNGFKRSATPLFWNIGQTLQDIYPGHSVNVPGASGNSFTGTAHIEDAALLNSSTFQYELGEKIVGGESSPYGFIQTGQRVRMGWMPTDAYQKFTNFDGATDNESVFRGPASVPEIPLITVILPQAYKTQFYYRVYVEETVLFKDAVAINPMYTAGMITGNYTAYQPFDRMIAPGGVAAYPGGTSNANLQDPHNNMNGGYV